MLEKLKETIEGDVRFDPISKSIYSVDASIYEVEPCAIVIPKSKEDVVKTVCIANENGAAIIPRGAATGITGGCLGSGIILDLSKYLNRILEVNLEKKYIVCEPGVVQDTINKHLAPNGYRLGPDTSTGNRATIGGMLGNNAAGARSLKYGSMVDHVRGVEMVLASGEVLCFEEIKASRQAGSRQEEAIYSAIETIRKRYSDDIMKRFPPIPRRVSGYNLNTLVQPQPLNVSKLIAGSEGTLGIATEITMNICPLPRKTGLCLLHFHDMIDAMRRIDMILSYHPLSAEMLDDKLINMAKQSPTLRHRLEWLVGNPSTVFAIELEEDNASSLAEKLEIFSRAMQKQGIGYAQVCLSDDQAMSAFWKVRSAGVGLLLSKRSYSRSVAFIEDISIPPKVLPQFMEAFLHYLKKIGKEAGIYGHIGSGCLHIRPYIDLRKRRDVQLMEKILTDVATLVLDYGGALSGEHGDGLIRSWLTKKMFGENIYQAFVELKQAFDPDNRMNPGKIVHPKPFLQNLRLSPSTSIKEMKTFLDFSKEGGLSLAADLCNGNALCRKKEETMCPSFQVSGDEYDTTRARAQALRSIINGKLPLEEYTGEGLHQILDLCIGCKGCKKECPSLVDMAKMKAELLYQYQEKHGYRFRDCLFGYIGKINRFSLPSVFNRISKSALGKYFLSRIGITPKRDLPLLAPVRFSRWYREHPIPDNKKKAVILLNDTFTEFHSPNIGIAAVEILETLGYRVIVPPWQCCGRPLISKGILKPAKRYATKLVTRLAAYEGIPIVGLEPSCLFTIKDDFQGLLGYHNANLNQVMKQCNTFDAFLATHFNNHSFSLEMREQHRSFLYHAHCYEKALANASYTLDILKALPHTEAKEIPSGCCGMAGAFGYEKEHFDFSMKIGELQLFPAIRQIPSNVRIVANGFSCRSQILQGTGQHSLHLAEVLSQNLKGRS